MMTPLTPTIVLLAIGAIVLALVLSLL